MALFLVLLLTVGIWAAGIFVLARLTIILVGVVVVSDAYQTVVFTDARPVATKLDLAPAVVLRSKMLGQSARQRFATAEFSAVPSELGVPVLMEATAVGALDNLSLQVGGVDFTGFIGTMRKLALRPTKRVSGTLAQFTDRLALFLTVEDGAGRREFLATRPLPKEDQTSMTIQGMIDEVLDRWASSQPGTLELSTDASRMAGTHETPDAVAKVAYRAGMRHLADYFSTRSDSDLAGAESAFRKYFAAQPPTNLEASLLLGMTLSERRKEIEAIDVLNSAVIAWESSTTNEPKPSPTKGAETPTLPYYRAWLLRETARIKLYTWTDLVLAEESLFRLQKQLESDITQLDVELDDDGSPKIPGSPRRAPRGAAAKRESRRQLLELRASVLAQLSRAYTHLIPELDRSTPTRTEPDLKKMAARWDAESTAPAVLAKGASLSPVPPAKTEPSLQGPLAVKMLNDSRGKCERAAEHCLKRAQSGRPFATEVTRRLVNDRAYAIFRAAQWESDDPKFQAECKLALRQMREAMLTGENDYTLLQNLATILANPRYDPSGRELQQSIELLRKSLEFKPLDYWANQRLALANIRYAVFTDGAEERKATLEAAINAAKASLEQRMSRTTELVLCLAYILRPDVAESSGGAVGRLLPPSSNPEFRERLIRLMWLADQEGALRAATSNGAPASLDKLQKAYDEIMGDLARLPHGGAARAWVEKALVHFWDEAKQGRVSAETLVPAALLVLQ